MTSRLGLRQQAQLDRNLAEFNLVVCLFNRLLTKLNSLANFPSIQYIYVGR